MRFSGLWGLFGYFGTSALCLTLAACSAQPIGSSPLARGNSLSLPGEIELQEARNSGINLDLQLGALRTAPRVALVIGNGTYSGGWGDLALPARDARAMAQSLTESGFRLAGGGPLIDGSLAAMQARLRDAEAMVRAARGAVVVVHYSGHGFANDGRNFLVPANASTSAINQPASALLQVREIADRLIAAGSGAVIMFLDACRENPDVTRLRGLQAEAGLPPRVFIGFAAQFGGVALEPQDGTLGVYTSALLRVMRRNFGSLEEMHLAAANEVILQTNGRQQPVYAAR